MELQDTREYKAARALGDSLNDSCWSPRKFAESVGFMHKTLQQTLTRTIVAVIRTMGDEAYRTDPRNQSAHELCKRIVQSGILDEAYLPLI